MMKHIAATSFGRRSVNCTQMRSTLIQNTKSYPDQDKWDIFSALEHAAKHMGITNRSLSVLRAILSFHPNRILCDTDNLVVYASNRALAQRAHGMPESTMRRHLSHLIAQGILTRRDSANGKRYALPARNDTEQLAFGLDLRPLLARADEINEAAEQAKTLIAEKRKLRALVGVTLRDVSKLIDHLQVSSQNVLEDVSDLRKAIRRQLDLTQLTNFLNQLTSLRDDLLARLECTIQAENTVTNKTETSKMSSSDVQNEQHLLDSNIKHIDKKEAPEIPLTLVFESCAEITLYHPHERPTWHSLNAVSRSVGAMMGIPEYLLRKAEADLGKNTLTVVLCCLLQKSETIKSPSAYLTTLARKARDGLFSPLPMLLALNRGG